MNEVSKFHKYLNGRHGELHVNKAPSVNHNFWDPYVIIDIQTAQ